ncbi:hypothetical protein BV25DRAFT_1058995 [Artomyces pyxidatus]|uniref:Uncharacterized protein n=1 Tax=Artomyces pyxidatus TaxID=48021 RepID=A0ACB8SSN3_9AGAM|nr:hypothetical protein BV25DRAFT_1058995 [Artomyces pyxidatus]
MPTLAPPSLAIRAAIAARLCLSSSSASTSFSPSSVAPSSPSGTPSAVGGGDLAWITGGSSPGVGNGETTLALAAGAASASSPSPPIGGDITTCGGGFHLGFSAGLGGGVLALGPPPPKAPRPCSAAIRSLSEPAFVMLSFASLADMPPPSWRVAAGGDAGGDAGLGAHFESPPGLGRGAGGASPEDAAGFCSNAAMRSRREPGFGFTGGGSDIVVERERWREIKRNNEESPRESRSSLSV